MLDFIKIFHSKVLEKKVNWEIKGLITSCNEVISLGSDSKLIGRIFELLSSPLMREIAYENGFELEIPSSQTTYPDFTLSKYGDDNMLEERIAIDIKTTYRKYNSSGELRKMGFTLGSYTSFLRNDRKNILYNYSTYDKHYVVGFIYDRVDNAIEGSVYNIDEDILVPYNNVEFFVQEKYKIVGEKPGSGNTENIGSISTKNIKDYINGNGVFSILGEDIYVDYWRNYPKNRASVKEYTNIEEYFDWKERKGIDMAIFRNLLVNE